jgi:hypothetical protein
MTTISPAVVVQVEDSFGDVVTSSSASVTLAIDNNPSGGTLFGTATMNASSGVATFNDLKIDMAGAGYTLSASSSGLTGDTSASFNISVGTASQLAFSGQPTDIARGDTFSPPVVVQVEDAGGNVVTSSSASITLTLYPIFNGLASLSGDNIIMASSGVATFNNLGISPGRTSALGLYDLNASSGSFMFIGTSNAFNVF